MPRTMNADGTAAVMDAVSGTHLHAHAQRVEQRNIGQPRLQGSPGCVQGCVQA